MNSAKPFVCRAIGCNQQFANESHLEVHRRKHEMSLGLRDFKTSLDTPVIADQTPTPTRFLKNCEEVGLFSELPNPFDAEFRKASELHRDDSDNNDDDEENDTTDDHTNTDLENGKNDPVISNHAIDSVIATVGDTTSTTATQSPPSVSSTTQEESQPMSVASVVPQSLTTAAASIRPTALLKTIQPGGQTVHTVQVQPQQQYQIAVAVQQQQVVAAAVAATNNMQPVRQVVQGGGVTATSTAAIVASTAATEANKLSIANVNSSFLNTMTISAPILLRLPNGQTIPVVPPSVANPAVQIPLAVSAVAEQQPTSKAAPALTPAPNNSAAVAAATEQANVKLKLKNALLTSQSQGNMGVMTQAVEVVTRQQQAITSTVQPTVLQNPKQEVTIAQLSPGKRRRNSDDDPDNKRARFLERNRAAATRCRNKRKQWITNLESKADELNNTNVKLQTEVTSLRNEVAQLKQLLLAHKDCPVTMMQRKAAQAQVEVQQVSAAQAQAQQQAQVQILAGSGTADLQAVGQDSDEAIPVKLVTTSDIQQQQQPTVITVQTLPNAVSVKQMAGPST